MKTLAVPALAAALFVAALLCSDTGLAQRRDPAAAEALFQQGRAAMAAKDLTTACLKFDESYRLDPTPGTLLNLAACHEQRGQLADAWGHYRALLEVLPASDDRRGLVQRKVQGLEPRLPKLLVRLQPGAPSEARVLRNGVEMGAGSLGQLLPANPGTHRLEVRLGSAPPRFVEVVLREGEVRELTLSPPDPPPAASAPPVVSAPPAPTAPPSASSAPSPVAPPPPVVSLPERPAPAAGPSRRAVAGYLTGGAGGLALAVGIGAGIWALDRRAVRHEHCDGLRCDARGLAAAGEQRSLGNVSTITLGVGLVSLGVAAYLLFTDPKPSHTARSPGLALSW